ncbi:CPBP family intramembrane metalloprotease, partial [bacterium CPR1]|nr:CPBP family intramembrane metalloprotease [bacterium CPR1]
MNWSQVRILLAHELRMVYRDGRTLVLSILLPLLLVPLVLGSLSMVNARRQHQISQTYLYVLENGNPFLRRLLEQSRQQLPGDEDPNPDRLRRLRFQEVSLQIEPEVALEDGTIDLILRFVPPDRVRPTEGRKPASSSDKKPPTRARFRTARLKGVPQLEVLYAGNREKSLSAVGQLTDRLDRVLDRHRAAVIKQAGWPGDVAGLVVAQTQDRATPAQLTGAAMGPYFALFLVLFLVGGGSVAALDGLAGEKERGSLETLLTTSAGRSEIIAAKQLATLTVALVIAAIQLLNSLLYLVLGLVPMPQGFVLEASAGLLLALALLVLPLAAFVAGILMLVSGFSRSYKEAQVLLFPVFSIMCVLSLTSLLPGLPLESAIVLVPVANVSVALREILIGHFPWPWLVATSLVTAGWAAWLSLRAARLLTDEKLVLPSLQESQLEARTPVGFGREAPRWYALMFVGVLLLNAALGTNLVAAIVVNQLLVFLLVPIWMLRHYRLSPVEALSLRLPRWPVWLAVLAFIPLAHLVGVGVSLLTGLLFPVPQNLLEQFSQMLQLKERPAWMLYLGLAVLPGVCEEIAFRGTFLYALRNRPGAVGWKVAVMVALVFGFFHFSLFRIPPTAVLGFFLTLICWWSRSIFPCMLAHVGNNALAVWASRGDVEMETMPIVVFLLALVGTLTCLWVIYRCRPAPSD